MLKFIEQVDSKVFLLVITLLYIPFIAFEVSQLSISYQEANIYFNQNNFLHYILNYSTAIFGQDDFGLRVVFIATNILNLILLYFVSKQYLKRDSDTNLLLLLYILVPATISASVIVNEAIITIFCVLLFLYLYQKFDTKAIYILPLFLFIDNSFFIFYFSLFFYGLYIKNTRVIIVSLILFGFSMYMYNFDMYGKPRNYFLDTISIYATIFTPLFFIYLFYALYKVFIKEQKNIIWFISFIPLIFSLLLSFRQKIYVEDFAPYILIGIVLSVRVFYTSYRGRLEQFRKKIKIMLFIVMGFMFLNFFIISTNKFLYHFIQIPTKHFAYNHHIAKDLANELKALNIQAIHTDNKKLALRLKFYGIENSTTTFLSKKQNDNAQKVSIRYINKDVEVYYVTKLNTNE